MQGAIPNLSSDCDSGSEDHLFVRIANDLQTRGYSINYGAMPEKLTSSLWHHLGHMHSDAFVKAGVGREGDHHFDTTIRTDEICWITGGSLAGRQWLKWAAELQQFLNRQLFLGLFSFESQFAHYAPGTYYRRHLDAFHGESNRLLSVVLYLNRGWKIEDAGELVIYLNTEDFQGIRVMPNWATIVVFLSEDFPHEVLPSKRDRYSVVGWYRLNTSKFNRIDPEN